MAKRPQQTNVSESSASCPAPPDADDRAEYEDESLLSVWLEQSPSWLVSMGVHMAIMLTLALCVMHGPAKADLLVEVFPEDNTPIENVALEEITSPEPLEITEPVETLVDVESEMVAQDSPPDVTPFDDPKLEASPVELNENAFVSVVSANSSNKFGNAKTGLGNRKTGASTGNKDRTWVIPPRASDSVKLALRWMAHHQNRDGSWSFNHTPGDGCSGFPNPGQKRSRMGATGLALLAFLGRGHTHTDTSKEHYQVVRRGVAYLISHMNVSNNAGRLFELDGDSHSHMYCHGIAACALAEAYGMTMDPKLQGPAQLALNYIVDAQHADGGWRYQPGDPGDTSALGWQLMAFKSGKMSYLTVPEHVYPQASKFLDAVQKNGGAEYGYMPSSGHGVTPATSSIGLLCRIYLGWKQEHPGLRRGVQLFNEAGHHPSNMYYNYYATMFMFQHAENPRSESWRKWKDSVMPFLLETQATRGGPHRIGSWHFPGSGLEAGLSDVGGRLYNTALAAMTLQISYRYERVYDADKGAT